MLTEVSPTKRYSMIPYRTMRELETLKAVISQSYVTEARQATNHAASSESRLSHHTYRINNASTNIIQSSSRSSAENISDLGLMARHKAEVEHRRVQNSKHFTQEGFQNDAAPDLLWSPYLKTATRDTIQTKLIILKWSRIITTNEQSMLGTRVRQNW